MWMYPVAIACGNTFILKPSEHDPSPSMLMAELWQDAGLPDGVFTVVHGDTVAVDALLDHPGGRDLLRRLDAGRRHVFERATRPASGARPWAAPRTTPWSCPTPTSTTADALIAAGYGSAGERCMAISAVVAVGTPTRWSRRSRTGPPHCVTGPGTDPASDMGPLITAGPTATGSPAMWTRRGPRGPSWWSTAGR